MWLVPAMSPSLTQGWAQQAELHARKVLSREGEQGLAITSDFKGERGVNISPGPCSEHRGSSN